MARIYPLFSSSRGNATYIGTPECGILIDAGVSFRRLSLAMERSGLPLSGIRAVFVTHDHSDHICGLHTLTANLQVPVYSQEKTLRNLIDRDQIAPNATLREIHEQVAVCDLQVSAFDTPHDTDQSCGYRVQLSDGRTCAVCTDLGHVTKTVEQALTGCDLVLLEANYDPQMLRNGRYPPNVKARIASGSGHLSNPDSADEAAKLIRSGTTRLVLGHLSQDNNRPAVAEQAVVGGLAGFIRGRDYLLEIAAPETDGRMIVF